MTHTYQIEGMHCGSCVTNIKNELLNLPGIAEADVQLKSPQATITMKRHISTADLQQAIAKAGAFTIKEQGLTIAGTGTRETFQSRLNIYKPLLIVFAFITVIATITAFQQNEFQSMLWMNNFMAGFFIVFSFFKFLDLRGFADSYSTYDLLAQKVYNYGFIYPFIELGLGIFYLTGWQPVYTNVVTVIVMGFSSIGVIKALMDKKKIRCACLGAVFNLPMSTITVLEDLLMAGMALFSLFMV